MIHVPCGTQMPAYDLGGVVAHLAGCPDTGPELGAWCRVIVSAVSRAADIETPAVSPETAATASETPGVLPETPVLSDETASVSRETPGETVRDNAVPTTARLAELRDSGMSLRDLGALAGVGHETVRRRIAQYRAGQVGVS